MTLTVTDNRGGTEHHHPAGHGHGPAGELPADRVVHVEHGYRTVKFTSTSTDEDGTIVSKSVGLRRRHDRRPAPASHTYAAAGTYTVTLTATDNGGDTATVDQPVTITDQYAADVFGRTVANGFGTADLGGAWTLSGAAASFSVNGGAGTDRRRRQRQPRGLPPGGPPDRRRHQDRHLAQHGRERGGAYVTIIGRRVSAGNDYRLKVRYQAGGSVVAYLAPHRGQHRDDRRVGQCPASRRAPATCSGCASSPRQQSDHAPGQGLARGTPEPLGWLVTGTDNTPAALQATR